MARTEHDIANEQAQLKDRLGALTAQYEYQKGSIMERFKQIDVELADARIEAAKSSPGELRAVTDAHGQVLARLEESLKDLAALVANKEQS